MSFQLKFSIDFIRDYSMHANENVWAAGKGMTVSVRENNHHSIYYSPSAHHHRLSGLGVRGLRWA